MSDERTVEGASTSAGRDDGVELKLEEFLPYRLNVVSSLTSQALSSIYAEQYRIGVPEWRVLVTLGQYGTMTGKMVGTHSHMHKTKVSRAVALLERRKLVSRRANKADMREAFLSLPYFDHIHRYLPALMIREGYSVAFEPVNHRHRTTGVSKYNNLGRLWASLSDLSGVIWLQSRARNPEGWDEA